MAKVAMLSVDLNNANSEQRSVFNTSLQEAQWLKLPRLTTIWTATFKDGVSEEGVVRTTRSDVATAAAKARITSYDAVVHVGDSNPTPFQA